MTQPPHAEVELDLTAPVPHGPEERTAFRLAQLLVLLTVAHDMQADIRTVDRLAYYEFFAANPFVAVSGANEKDIEDRLDLRLAGFLEGQLTYATAGQRFIGRRQRLQHDLALLIAYGLAEVTDKGYSVTQLGLDTATRLEAQYKDQYSRSAHVILGRLRRLSDRRLREKAASGQPSSDVSPA